MDVSGTMSGDRTWARFDVVAETRRRWSQAEKRSIVAEAARSGTGVSAVARRHGIAPSLLFRWKQQLGDEAVTADRPLPAFVPVVMPAPPVAAAQVAAPSGAAAPLTPLAGCGPERIEVVLANGRQLRFAASLDVALLKRLIAVVGEP